MLCTWHNSYGIFSPCIDGVGFIFKGYARFSRESWEVYSARRGLVTSYRWTKTRLVRDIERVGFGKVEHVRDWTSFS